MGDWDVVVIGAGPAGAVAGHALAREGRSVLVVEKAAFQRAKVCGCCLGDQGLARLRALGFGEAVHRLGPPELDRLRLWAGGQVGEAALPGGVAVSRAGLDQALMQQAQAAGAVFQERTAATVRPGEPGADRRTVQLVSPWGAQTVSARVVLAADGLAGTSLRGLSGFEPIYRRQSHMGLAATTGAGASPPAGTVSMACGEGGYVGRVRLETGGTAVAAALRPAAVRRAGHPGRAASEIIASATGRPLPLADADWQGTGLLSRRRAVAGPRLLVTGDAAGYVEPFTGEGMSWAIAGGEAAAQVAEEAIQHGWSDELADTWQRRHRQTVGGAQRRCQVVAAGLRRPAVVKGAVRLMRRHPGLARRAARQVVGAGRDR